MRQTKAARTYAKSLLDLAVEQGVLEDVKNDMELILKVCEESKELQAVLSSPVVPADKKLTVLNELFGKKVSKLTSSFIQLIVAKGRGSLLANISFSFADLYLANKNILRAVIKSVDGVGDILKKKVAELVKATYDKEVLIEEEKDETLIGGFVITIGDKQINASISQQLANMQNALS
ncbi:MAG: F-type H+-transporting ATPase subunit delta [Glaciecola sp.]|jgi:F-type H+-transporting ATPase subunit delta